MKKVLMFVVLVSFGFAFISISSCSSVSKKSKTESISSSDLYMCPMHPEMKSNEPGICAKCGMNLEKPPFRHAVITGAGTVPAPATEKISKPKDLYYCPMHPKVKKSKPGKCPECGMNLVKAGIIAEKPILAEKKK